MQTEGSWIDEWKIYVLSWDTEATCSHEEYTSSVGSGSAERKINMHVTRINC